MGHPVLSRRAEQVPDPGAPEVRALITHMAETMADAEGLGLAAPQIHVSRRVVIFHTPASPEEEVGEDDSAWSELTVLVNPVVEPLDEEDLVEGWEGCLSVPGLRGLVPRWRRVRYRGMTHRGEEVDRTAEGLHARVVQHECDHLDGILYPSRMTDLSKLVFESEMRHFRASTGGEAPVGEEEGSGEDVA